MFARYARALNPHHIFVLLDQIDKENPSYTLDRATSLRRVFSALATVSVCLLLIHYLKMQSAFQQTLLLIDELLGLHLINLINGKLGQLAAYGWWTFWHLTGYVLIPCLLIRSLWRESIADFGWRWQSTHKHWRGYLLLLCPILVFVVIASQGESFVSHYPFYRLAGRSWFDLIAWELLYLSQFVFLEFFFRGFILQALRPALGANAVWIMCVPYLMIHFPKLWPEAFGAILFGLFLGILALRSCSIWGGVMVHAGVALSMDLAALLQKSQWPTQWWP